MARKAAYHHGDLRRVLVDASLALIDEVGVVALSLREVARKAGVSHNAPYHHFPDKASLLTAIAMDGFGELAHEMEVARAAAEASPRARLEACGLAYVRFALRAPSFFRVMFRPDVCTDDKSSPLAKASEPVFNLLVQSVLECQAAGLWPPGDPTPLVLTCWSSVHGLASLWLEGPLQLDPKGFGVPPEELAMMVVKTLSSMLREPVPAPARQKRRAPVAHRPGGSSARRRAG